jgi:hypothetical protein
VVGRSGEIVARFGLDPSAILEIREGRWAEMLARCLERLGKTRADAQRDRKSAPWKAAVALTLKERTQASNRWLTGHLHMGRPEAVSVYVQRLRTSGVAGDRDC